MCCVCCHLEILTDQDVLGILYESPLIHIAQKLLGDRTIHALFW
jgi:hypothetical protein